MRKKELSKSARKVLREAVKKGVAYFSLGTEGEGNAESIMEGKKLFQFATADFRHWMYRIGDTGEPRLVEITSVDHIRHGVYCILLMDESAPATRQIKGKKAK